MIDRYKDIRIAEIFSDEAKVLGWQETELAVMRAYADRGDFPIHNFYIVQDSLLANPCDIAECKRHEAKTRHDLNAFLEERLPFIPENMRPWFHRGITSYDTEESASVRTLDKATVIVLNDARTLENTLIDLALKYRYTPMLLRSHGQGAEAGSFGKRIISWLQEVRVAVKSIEEARKSLRFSKISGACGNYTSIDPEIERKALDILGLEPFYGATQILPRALWVPLASSLYALTAVINKIAVDFRLGARSGERVLYREPFGKGQKGSSAMPHKKNPINLEQTEGLARLALGCLVSILQNIETWEERAIEQSCVERVAWPDLFHVTLRAIKNINTALSKMEVFTDNMMAELVESRGCYAATEAQRVMKDLVTEYGLTAEDGYRIVQLAAFNLFEKKESIIPPSLVDADLMLGQAIFDSKQLSLADSKDDLKTIILHGRLRLSSELEATEEQINAWKNALGHIFATCDCASENRKKWEEIFSLSYLLRNEYIIYLEVLGI